MIHVVTHDDILQMGKFGSFLNSSLRRMVRSKICVGRVWLARSMVMIVAHWPTVVHIGGRRMREVSQTEDGRPRICHGIHIIAPNIDGASLYMWIAITIALKRMRVIFRSHCCSSGVSLLSWRAAIERSWI